jgi:hypothetical protein
MLAKDRERTEQTPTLDEEKHINGAVKRKA